MKLPLKSNYISVLSLQFEVLYSVENTRSGDLQFNEGLQNLYPSEHQQEISAVYYVMSMCDPQPREPREVN